MTRAHFIFVVFLLISGVLHADDFGTINGRNYDGVTVVRAEPDGVVVKTKSGISKLYFYELRKRGPASISFRF
jgi:hypothetical protein